MCSKPSSASKSPSPASAKFAAVCAAQRQLNKLRNRAKGIRRVPYMPREQKVRLCLGLALEITWLITDDRIFRDALRAEVAKRASTQTASHGSDTLRILKYLHLHVPPCTPTRYREAIEACLLARGPRKIIRHEIETCGGEYVRKKYGYQL
jgi:hypothetical protein